MVLWGVRSVGKSPPFLNPLPNPTLGAIVGRGKGWERTTPLLHHDSSYNIPTTLSLPPFHSFQPLHRPWGGSEGRVVVGGKRLGGGVFGLGGKDGGVMGR